MTASVRINYDRFVNTGLVPATDYENAVMEEILRWAGDTLHPSTEITLPNLINLYWGCQFGDIIVEAIETDGQAEIIPLSEATDT
ncbi:hypothetical protein PHIM7_120 [Sinorhizobium phage phiM7]|uniref:Uncharacterized protein n=3 Tax=Emdodecavirus TaxID=1980937 RepID=S5MV79_9CAUD|nr:hypothetical protein AB690_gp375 [Sinorhizobium phage phiM12]YP_009212374.1 hypothetical protein AVT40_gp399 [Sinorhizobium phage phiN3]YP_009601245.1 hypothetical protein FDH46_gp358 [Sinorhizobium phage phiM7]AKF13026.1 hypothetical protein PHIM19_121 [Sinorhizobium phage phiM19]AGR47812.2 hypothetical protein SmphiM12_180 [Sinorhizobium phage phiM12]AKF12666.1 hypothetical protein PHIM7_120 [Sinorhizobium phage phiM7]AKF13397.1 hypothetical protein PHIN3_134 [Sinorhizobium phage phiN3]